MLYASKMKHLQIELNIKYNKKLVNYIFENWKKNTNYQTKIKQHWNKWEPIKNKDIYLEIFIKWKQIAMPIIQLRPVCFILCFFYIFFLS